MNEEILVNLQQLTNEKNLKIASSISNENLEKDQEKFIETKLGQAINKGINIGLKAILPNVIEDEIIAVKDSLLTEGFSAAVDTAIKEATNLGKSLTGIVTGNFENISQIKDAIKKGGLIDTISSLLSTGIEWAEHKGYITRDVSVMIEKGKETIMNTITSNIEETLGNQIEAVEKMDGYIDKWYKYYEEQNFNNMEYQYDKIKEYIKEVIPLEETLKKARTVENLHELIKNNGKNFDITNEEKELAEMLVR